MCRALLLPVDMSEPLQSRCLVCRHGPLGSQLETVTYLDRNLHKNAKSPTDAGKNSEHFPILTMKDAKLLLTKNYSEIIIFGKITILTRNSLNISFFPGHFEST